MTTGASQADMTLIIACVSTRPAVQRETIVRVTGEVKVKLLTALGSRATLPVEAWLPRANSTTALQGKKESRRARRDDRELGPACCCETQ